MEEGIISQMIDSLALTEYEAKAYIALVKMGSLTIVRLSEVSAIPRPKCYSVMRSLMSKGMVSQVMSRPMRCQALPPDIAFKNRLSQLEDELDRKRETSNRVLRGLKNLMLEEGPPSPEYHIYMIEGPKNIVTSIVTDLEAVKREILVAITRSPARIDWKKILNAFEKLRVKDLTFKHLTPSLTSPNVWEDDMGSLRELSERGRVQIRFNADVHQPFAILDEQVTYIFFTDLVKRELSFALRIEDERFARHMKTFFEFLWQRGNSLS